MAFYDELIEATKCERDELMSIPFIQQGGAGKLSLESYVAFLTEAYHHVKHTTPLLMSAGGRIPERLEWLRQAIGEYIEEEMGHQEWILNDLNACGADGEVVRQSAPAPATELMVAYAYDTIGRVNPVGLFGMVLVLEGASVALATHAADHIQSALGLPDSAFSYLRSHGALDVRHMGFFGGLMNRIEDREDQMAIVHAAQMFYKLYGDIFRGLPLVFISGELEDN
jgi:pyrroloquinoline quinone (PQQ) biosynthesis protein C